MQVVFLKDVQRDKMEPLLPKYRSKGRPWVNNREILEGILWVLRSGARWRDMPLHYPSASTCWRRFKQWEEDGIRHKIWRKFLSQLDQKRALSWSDVFLDWSFTSAPKRELCVGKTKRGKGLKWMVVVEGSDIPLGSQIASVSSGDATLAGSTLDLISIPRSGRGEPKRKLQRVVADRAYNSTKLRLNLAKRNIELVCSSPQQ